MCYFAYQKMDSYIVRIYRRDQQKSSRLVGTVEQVGAKGQKAFHGMDELCTILSKQRRRRRGGKRETDILNTIKESYMRAAPTMKIGCK